MLDYLESVPQINARQVAVIGHSRGGKTALWAGAQDPRVKLTEHEAIVNGLRARGVDVGYFVAENEGHGFTHPDNVHTMWRLVEDHFARHLGGRRP